MKRLLKGLLYLVVLVVCGVIGLMFYIKIALPSVGDAPQIKVESTPQQIERGKYLAYHVAVCMDCHSRRDWTKFSGPLLEGSLGKGNELFDQNFGFPGKYTSKNITPFHLKDWTDGELYRAITCGVSKDGSPLFPVMPYMYYGKMAEQDVLSIIAFIRMLPEAASEPAVSESDFPMNFIIHTIPTKQQAMKLPSAKDTIAYGAYLTNAAGCMECHTKQEKGQKLEGMEYAGGFEFPLPNGLLISPNITPHQTGIGDWTVDHFVKKFKSYEGESGRNIPVQQGDFQTVMPWTMYAGMTESDLRSIYAFLRTLKPIEHSVVKFTPKS